MRHPFRVLIAVGVVAVCCRLLPSAFAATASSSVTVGASARPFARISDTNHPSVLTLTSEDVSRGYVDVCGTRIGVRTNQESYTLRFDIAGAPILFAEARTPQRRWTLGPEGGRIGRDVDVPGEDRLDIVWRLYLVETARPGTYAWPIRATIDSGRAFGYSR